jgi:hypothetical protein
VEPNPRTGKGAFRFPGPRWPIRPTPNNSRTSKPDQEDQDGENTSGAAFGRSWTKHDLPTLYEREKYLTRMAAREANGGKIP